VFPSPPSVLLFPPPPPPEAGESTAERATYVAALRAANATTHGPW
jgi:hypothetical protein